MSSLSVPLKAKLRLSATSFIRVMAKPLYLIGALAVSVVLLGVLIWLSNFSLLGSVLFDSSLSLSRKADFYLQGYRSLFTNFETWAATGLVVFAALTGINLAILVFVKKGELKAANAAGKSAGATLAALIGLGCAACGTSLLGPLLAGAGAVISLSVLEIFGVIASLLGLGLLLYSIYGLGLQAATVIAQNR